MSWDVLIRMAGQWITYEQATEYLGVPDSSLDAAIAAGLVEQRGERRGYRLNAAHVHALGVLWARIEPLLGLAGEKKRQD